MVSIGVAVIVSIIVFAIIYWSIKRYCKKDDDGEFFIDLKKGIVYFSELSPRPHDTGMVTLANTQNYNEFELHARMILGLSVDALMFFLEKAPK